MAYDHEEQEQLETFKAWWAQYGNLITWLVTFALTAYAAWSGWNYYQRNQATQASQLYGELQKSVTAKDSAKVQRAATDMQQKFARTAYAQMSSLVAAKDAFDANDLKAAKSYLQWVVEHGVDDEFKSIAKIRLAGIMLDEKMYDEALKQLAENFPEKFASPVADRRGDIFLAQNKNSEARAAYQQALDKSEKNDPARQLIQLKLDALGGEVSKAASN